jgi:hypothetical protein
MAICRCLRLHSPPHERSGAHVGYVLPLGYPDAALVCGATGCTEPGVIWLQADEELQYKNGNRIFRGAGDGAQMRADDSGIHVHSGTQFAVL